MSLEFKLVGFNCIKCATICVLSHRRYGEFVLFSILINSVVLLDVRTKYSLLVSLPKILTLLKAN